MSRTRLAAVAFSAALLLAGCAQEPGDAQSAFVSTDITGVPWGRDLRLTDHQGRPRQISDFRGKVVMVFFGYTHCPDVCPTTLSDMAHLRASLGDEGRRVQGLFVTVDPARDTPELLAQYVPAFDPSFIGLRGDPQQTAAVAADFKFHFAAQKPDGAGHYTVDHGGGIYVYDPAGQLRLLMRSGNSIEAMAADVRKLLQER